MNIKDIINKIKNKEHLDDNELEHIIKMYSIYTEEGHRNNYYFYMSALCKLEDLYVVIYWDKNLNKKLKTKYYQPMVVINMETRYLHIITLEDDSLFTITADKRVI